ncbi:MAG: hypothetical protein JSW61_08150 [Candidatus Thorarchaeota archaeon]|nr:MAG: hypothetical protein JSW61_08150 [Candidatus Thorarchaeota archaeon]
MIWSHQRAASPLFDFGSLDESNKDSISIREMRMSAAASQATVLVYGGFTVTNTNQVAKTDA